MSEYRILPDTLGNVLRFNAGVAALVDARAPEPAQAETDPAGEAATTAADMYSDAGQQRARQALAQSQADRTMALFVALIDEGKAVDVARLIVERADGLPISLEEADRIPSDLFCHAWTLFLGKSGTLTSAALGLPGASASTGADRVSAQNPKS